MDTRSVLRETQATAGPLMAGARSRHAEAGRTGAILLLRACHGPRVQSMVWSLAPQAAMGLLGVLFLTAAVGGLALMTGGSLAIMWNGRARNMSGPTPAEVNAAADQVEWGCAAGTCSWCVLLPFTHCGAALLQGCGIAAASTAAAWRTAMMPADDPPANKPPPRRRRATRHSVR